MRRKALQQTLSDGKRINSPLAVALLASTRSPVRPRVVEERQIEYEGHYVWYRRYESLEEALGRVADRT